MSGHSPGPWFFVDPSKLHGRQYNDWIITYGDGHNWVCLGPEWDASFQEESNANARLIAAAPDMLAALMSLDNLQRGGHPHESVITAAWAELDAAIAKATGEPK